MHPKALAYANRVATVSASSGVYLAEAYLLPLGQPTDEQRRSAVMHFTGFCWIDAIGVWSAKVSDRESRLTLSELSRQHTAVALAIALQPVGVMEAVPPVASTLDDWLFELLVAWGNALRLSGESDWKGTLPFILAQIAAQPAFVACELERPSLKVNERLDVVIPLLRKESLAAARYARPAVARWLTGAF